MQTLSTRVRSLALLLAVALGTGALAACGGGGESAGGGSGPQLVVGRVKDVVGLDPAHETDGISHTTTQLIFQNLVRFKPGTFEIEPEIADSWTTSADSKTWTFKLKPDLKFTDGTPLDAEAVKFNFDRWRLKSNPYHGSYPYAYYASQFGGYPGVISDVTVTSPTEIVFHLATPFGPFLRNVAMAPFAIGSPDAIKKDPEAFGLKPVGSGPYTLGEWIKNDHITLTANPSYNGPKPAYPTVIIRDIPDQSTGVLSIQKGDIDGLIDPRPDDAKELATEKGLTVYSQPSNNVLYLALNLERKPFDNVLVRRAVALAIDKQAIAQGFYAAGAVVADNWTPPGMLGENPKVKAYPHDVAQAKALLAKAGFPNGFKTQLYLPTAPRPYMPEPQRIAEAIQANLKDIGIDATLVPLEFAAFLKAVRNGEHPACLIGWTGDNGDPDNFTYTLLDKDSAVKPDAQNYSFWRDEHFHALMLRGQQTVDEAQRQAIYAEANALIHDQAPAIPITHSVVQFAFKSSVDGVIPTPESMIHYELMKPKAP
jgi:peptide/nickel transport system substrate-binding protein